MGSAQQDHRIRREKRMSRLKELCSILFLTATLVVLFGSVSSTAEGIISKVPHSLGIYCILNFRQLRKIPSPRIGRNSRIQARAILSTFMGLAIMTLLAKRRSSGKKGIFSEKSIEYLATSERADRAGRWPRSSNRVFGITDRSMHCVLPEIAEHLFIIFIVNSARCRLDHE